MVFDRQRNVSILITQRAGSAICETWEWNGLAWSLASTAGPQARRAHAIAFDSVRNVIVLHGGLSSDSEPLADMWEWNGAEWRDLETSSGPSPRFGHGMAFDQSNSKLVLFGGANDSQYFNDLWEFEGETWTRRQPTAMWPEARAFHGMSFDPGRNVVVVSFGELCVDPSSEVPECFSRSSIWEWNGTRWTVEPQDRSHGGPSVAFDSVRRLTLIQGSALWAWDGRLIFPIDGTACGARDGYAMAFNRATGETMLFGGIGTTPGAPGPRGDTWNWDGKHWFLASQTGPEPRYYHSMTYMDHTRKVVLFGGFQSGRFLGDTWEWDGNQWQRSDQSGPFNRYASAMAYDQKRKVAVLFGGYDGFGGLSDTWEWNGFKWSLIATTGPTARWGHKMVYDSNRKSILLYGGRGVAALPPYPVYGDMWEWDGSKWVFLDRGPTARFGHGLVFDSDRNVLMVIGGTSSNAYMTDSWVWNGQEWEKIGGPLVRVADAAFDELRHQSVTSNGEETFAFPGCDSDRDGLDDTVDGCFDSDLRLSIFVQSCIIDAHNHRFEDGCTMNDHIAECGNAMRSDVRFGRCVRQLTRQWLRDELLTSEELLSINRCLRSERGTSVEESKSDSKP